MRDHAPFRAADLEELDEFFSQAAAVVALEDVVDGDSRPDVIGLRHDVDAGHALATAVKMAEWEAERGYRATYYLLHTASYWQDKKLLRASLERISECGHEIGIHSNALTVALQTGRDPVEVLAAAIAELRHWGYPVRSSVAHGDPLCHVAKYVNDEIFSECARARYGSPIRTVEHHSVKVTLEPVSMTRFGLEFDANWLTRADALSDSGSRWSRPFEDVAAAFPPAGGQLHVLVHPDWWGEAFASLKQANVAQATV